MRYKVTNVIYNDKGEIDHTRMIFGIYRINEVDAIV